MDQARNLLVRLALLAQCFNLIAQHSHNGLNGKTLWFESGGRSEGILRFQHLFH